MPNVKPVNIFSGTLAAKSDYSLQIWNWQSGGTKINIYLEFSQIDSRAWPEGKSLNRNLANRYDRNSCS